MDTHSPCGVRSLPRLFSLHGQHRYEDLSEHSILWMHFGFPLVEVHPHPRLGEMPEPCGRNCRRLRRKLPEFDDTFLVPLPKPLQALAPEWQTCLLLGLIPAAGFPKLASGSPRLVHDVDQTGSHKGKWSQSLLANQRGWASSHSILQRKQTPVSSQDNRWAESTTKLPSPFCHSQRRSPSSSSGHTW